MPPGLHKLVLTESEREAFSWVGDRYATGCQVRSTLMDCIPANKEWDDVGDIEFLLDFRDIQIIYDLAKIEDFQWPCFGNNLKNKMNELIQLPY